MSTSFDGPHLSLSHRKALAIRIAAAIALEGRPLPNATKYAKSKHIGLLEIIRTKADALGEVEASEPSQSVIPLDASIKSIAEDIDEFAIEGDGPALDNLRARRDQFVASLRRIDCSSCARGGPVCRGMGKHDDIIVGKGGHCISELKELVNLVEAWSDSLYQLAAARFPGPRIVLSTLPAHKHADQGLLKYFDMSGWSEVLPGTNPASLVGLEIRERAFNWDALCGALYIVAHEVVCHGYQSLNGAVRKSAEEKCSWSEGWMDRLAFELSREWLTHRAKELPTWLRRGTRRVEEVAIEVHRRRYEPSNTLVPSDAERRDAARAGFDALRNAWETGTSLEQGRATRFSVKLNLLGLPDDQLDELAQLLAALLDTEGSGRYYLALQACDEFVDGLADPSQLEERLRFLLMRR